MTGNTTEPVMPLGEELFVSHLTKVERGIIAEYERTHFEERLRQMSVAEYKQFLDALSDELSRLTYLKEKLSRVASIARGVVLR